MSHTAIVPSDIAIQSAELIGGGNAVSVRKGVELILLNNVYIAESNNSAGKGQSDVSVLLRQGLDYLSKTPFETLGVAVGSNTTEIRKAFKKNALKYHPDKNPRTTPLFQLMNAAADRLTDSNLRKKEERTAAARQSQNAPTASANPYAKYGNPIQKSNSQQKANEQSHNFYSQYNQGNNAAYKNYSSNQNNTYYPGAAAAAGSQWSEPEWSNQTEKPRPQHQPPPLNPKAQEQAKRKEYYDNILREQFRKEEEARKAKEYANIRENLAKQNAKMQANINNAYKAYDHQKPEGSNKYEHAHSNANADRKAYAGMEGSSQTTSESSSYSYNYEPGNRNGNSNQSSSSNSNSDSSSTSYSGIGVGRRYKATADGNVEPQDNSSTHQNNNKSSVPNSSANVPVRESLFGGPKSNENKDSSGVSKSSTSNTNSTSSAGGIAASEKVQTNRVRVPRPTGLRCVFIGTSAAELEWNVTKYHRYRLVAELSWRVKDGGNWESASKMISSGRCRKKNLLSGTAYEFRVRAVEEPSGGTYGGRSEWSDSIHITLMADKSTPNISRVPSSFGRSGIYNNNKESTDRSSGSGNRNNNTESNGLNRTKSKPAMNPSLESLAANLRSGTNKGNTKENFGANVASAPTFESIVEEGATKSRNSTAKIPDATGSLDTNKTSSQPKESAKPSENKTPPVDNNDSTATPNSTDAEHKFMRFSRHNPSHSPPPAAANLDHIHTNTRSSSEKVNTAYSTADDSSLESKSTPVSPMYRKGRGTDNKNGMAEEQNSADDASPILEMHKVKVDPHKRFPGSRSNAELPTSTTTNGSHTIHPLKKTQSKRAWDDNIVDEAAAEVDDDVDKTVVDEEEYHGQDFEISNAQSKDVAEEVISEDDEPNSKAHGTKVKNVNTKTSSKAPNKEFTKKASSVNDENPPAHSKALDRKNSFSSPSKGKSTPSKLKRKSSKNKLNKVKSTDSIKASKDVGDNIGFSVDDGDDDSNPFDDDSFEMEEEQYYKLNVPKTLKDKQGRVRHFSSSTYRHPVRAEPFSKSAPIGFLTPGKPIVATADCGDWLKVRIHSALKESEQKSSKSRKIAERLAANPNAEMPWGWCVREDRAHKYLELTSDNGDKVPSNKTTDKSNIRKSHKHDAPGMPHSPSEARPNGTLNRSMKHKSLLSIPKGNSPLPNSKNRSTDEDPFSTPPKKENSHHHHTHKHHHKHDSVEEWLELYDDQGNQYYYNEKKNISSWDPPDWVEEIDPTSGHKYYVNLSSGNGDADTLHSTWNPPKHYARLIRPH